MTTRHFLSNVTRFTVLSAFALFSTSCGSELLRTGRSPVYLTISSFSLTNGATGNSASNLLSDVQTLVEQQINGQTVKVPTIFNDTATASLRVVAKDPTRDTTDMNSVTVNRYRIVFRRADGRSTPGVDVPFGWDGGLSVTIPAGSEAQVPFDIVRHSSKSEPPLANLVNNGGVQYIYAIAEITFFGRDQNGNELTVTGLVDIAFSDFGDPQ